MTSNGLQLFNNPENAQTPASFYFRRKHNPRLKSQKNRWQTGVLPTVAEIADPNASYLLDVYDDLSRHGGPAPGPDGLRYDDVSRTEMAEALRVITQAIQASKYLPYPARIVPIPKPNGKTRKLSVQNLTDRVVSAGLQRALQPFWERRFHARSMGFRPRRGVWTLLARLEKEVIEENNPILAVDDIQDAFPSVPIDAVLADHALFVKEGKLLGLIEAVLRGDEHRKVGIDQGSAFSPLALNVRLNFAHDLGFRQGRSPVPFWRYADNLVYVAPNVSEGNQILSEVNGLLSKNGFHLKRHFPGIC